MQREYTLAAVMDVLSALIGPDGCPWDKEQTAASLCDYVVEETFELTEAIRDGDVPGTREELGDVLFLLCFLIRLFENDGSFQYTDIVAEICSKMIRRHPHVFDTATNIDKAQIWANWEKIKKREKKSYSVLGGIPKGLPPLLKAYRIHSKAARAGFTWKDDAGLMDQIRSEWRELEQAEASGDKAAQKEEFGDLLFTLVEYGRRSGIKCEDALTAANAKFMRRFAKLETKLAHDGRDLHAMTPDEQDVLWRESKKP